MFIFINTKYKCIIVRDIRLLFEKGYKNIKWLCKHPDFYHSINKCLESSKTKEW